jgi:hypothetical protein
VIASGEAWHQLKLGHYNTHIRVEKNSGFRPSNAVNALGPRATTVLVAVLKAGAASAVEGSKSFLHRSCTFK